MKVTKMFAIAVALFVTGTAVFADDVSGQGAVSGDGSATGAGVFRGNGNATGNGAAIYRNDNGNIRVKRGEGTVSGQGIAIGRGSANGSGRGFGRGSASGSGHKRHGLFRRGRHN
ncbi:MAG: hypothetical protein C0469_10345 [Cyanobacteria bacterium DS2.3.42]|nr:hypothetical protein [Cyanobacteria bacterium DS2.3.42]